MYIDIIPHSIHDINSAHRIITVNINWHEYYNFPYSTMCNCYMQRMLCYITMIRSQRKFYSKIIMKFYHRIMDWYYLIIDYPLILYTQFIFLEVKCGVKKFVTFLHWENKCLENKRYIYSADTNNNTYVNLYFFIKQDKRLLWRETSWNVKKIFIYWYEKKTQKNTLI